MCIKQVEDVSQNGDASESGVVSDKGEGRLRFGDGCLVLCISNVISSKVKKKRE